MLCAYMLLVIIYMLCAYMLLVKSFTCYWWWNWWCKHVLEYTWCGLVKYIKYVLLLSSPSSHTVGLVTFISMLVIGYLCILYSECLFGVIWCVYMHRGDGLGDERKFGATHNWVGLVTLYVSRKSRVCLWAWWEYVLVLVCWRLL